MFDSEHVDKKFIGALIEATLGESFLRGRVLAEGWVPAGDRYVSDLVSEGYIISVIEEAAKQPLPTELGIYTYDYSVGGRVYPLLYVLTEDGWVFSGFTGEKRSVETMLKAVDTSRLVRLVAERGNV